MSDDTTPRLALPFLQTGQAQKELTHNEALALLDVAVQPIVETIGLTAPPAAATPGQCWVVGTAATGAWTGRDNALAAWTTSGWRFLAAIEGMAVWSRADTTVARYLQGHWEVGSVRAQQVLINGIRVVAARQPAIAPVFGGTVIDILARRAIANIITTLQQHGLIET
ncbi:DUF2793 domain-containing protein [Sphingomonas sp. PAMC 26617]|uniref:DUF2793 domain-containing protein n=1 Tax=Sphingomonas sp. PAMC 26617 TaxID=1112216 RepID=UPI0002893018|nr:DUF2793 domain-containing protein [Sphingomonas sp. PAMC 26617]